MATVCEFGVDRDLARSADGTADEGNGADELGGATFIPQRKVPGEIGDGVRRHPRRRQAHHRRAEEQAGFGLDTVDGYGVVDAERAVLGR